MTKNGNYSRRNNGCSDRPAVRIKFGGWHNGDNHKPGRGWFFVCRCGHVGLGQILLREARQRWKTHAVRCDAIERDEIVDE